MRAVVKSLSLVLVMALAMGGAGVPVASASMVGTEAMLSQLDTSADRARIHAFLQRAEVRGQLERYGIRPDEASARVASLSDREVAWLVGKLDGLPAGAGGFETVVITALIVFLVLLLTDILGFTDLFPWAGPRQ
jgi:hypothetical protein